MIRDVLIPSQLRVAAGTFSDLDPAAFRHYRDALVAEAKSADVLEQTLLEQVALAHLSAFRLLAAAGIASTSEAVGIYASAAAKLMGEVRRTIVALKEIRHPQPGPTINVAQQVSVGAAGAAQPLAEEKAAVQSQQGSNDDARRNRLREIFGEGAGREAESEAGRSPHRTRPAEAAGSRASKSGLAV